MANWSDELFKELAGHRDRIYELVNLLNDEMETASVRSGLHITLELRTEVLYEHEKREMEEEDGGKGDWLNDTYPSISVKVLASVPPTS